MGRPRFRVVAVLAVVACESGLSFPDVEPEREGKIVDLAVADGVQVCAGDLVALDAHADFVARAIGTPEGTRVLYFWTHWQDVSDYCWYGAGCAHPEGAVGSSLEIGFHEVAHLLAAHLGRSKSLWEEGLAQGFEPFAVGKGEHHPEAMLEQAPAMLSYPQSAHFFRWAWQQTPDEILDVYAATVPDESHTRSLATFERIMGESLLEVGDRYTVEAPDEIPSLRTLEETPVLPWTGDVWRQVVRFDCEEEHTRTWWGWLRREVFFEVTEPGDYEVVLPIGNAVLETALSNLAPSYYAELSGVTTHSFVAGRYSLDIAVPPDPIDLEIVIRPAVGVQPTSPD